MQKNPTLDSGPQTPAPSPETPNPSSQTRAPIRVLLVEDCVPIRQRIRSLIEEAGAGRIVGEAGTVAEALTLFRTCAPDAVVLDLSLPDGDGRLVLAAIKRVAPACVVMVLTSFVGDVFRVLCLDAGADYFFDKAREFERVPEVLAALRRESVQSGIPHDSN